MFTYVFIVLVSVLQGILAIPVEVGLEASGTGDLGLAGSNGIGGKVKLGGNSGTAGEVKLGGSIGTAGEVKLDGNSGTGGKVNLDGSIGTGGEVKLDGDYSSVIDSVSVDLGSLIESVGNSDLVLKLINGAYQIEQAKLNALGNVAEGALDGLNSASKIPVKVLNLAIEIARNISTGVGLNSDLKIDLAGLVDSAGDIASTLYNAALKLEEIKINAIKNAIAMFSDAASAGLKFGSDMTKLGVDTASVMAKTGINAVGDGISRGLNLASGLSSTGRSLFNRAGTGSGGGSADASFSFKTPSVSVGF